MQWVSVNVRMPEEDPYFAGVEQCRCLTYDCWTKTVHYAWRWQIDGVWKWCPTYNSHRISHWTPIPPPPDGLELLAETINEKSNMRSVYENQT